MDINEHTRQLFGDVELEEQFSQAFSLYRLLMSEIGDSRFSIHIWNLTLIMALKRCASIVGTVSEEEALNAQLYRYNVMSRLYMQSAIDNYSRGDE